MEKYLLGRGLVYGDAGIIPISQLGGIEQSSNNCLRVVVDGTLSPYVSPNTRFVRRGADGVEVFVRAEALRPGDEIKFLLPKTSICQDFSDEEYWVLGEKFSVGDVEPPVQLLPGSPKSLLTFLNGYFGRMPANDMAVFRTARDAFFFQLAASKANGALAKISPDGFSVSVSKRPSHTGSLWLRVDDVQETSSVPLQVWGFTESLKMSFNGFAIAVG